MALLFVVNYLDRINVSFAAIRMSSDLGLSATAFGLGAGLLFLSYALFEAPSNIIMYRVGARLWIARIMVSWGVCATGMAFIQGEASFYVLRFLLGACEAGFLPGMILYLTFWFPRNERGRLTALFMLAVPVAAAIGAPLSTVLMELGDGAFGLAGWRFMFLVEGLPAILLGFVVWKILPNRPEDARWLSPQEKVALRHALITEDQHIDRHGIRSLRAALRDSRLYLVAMIGFGASGGLYALTYFLPQIVAAFQRDFGVDLSMYQIGLITAVPFGTAAVAMWWYAARSDRRQERILHIAVPLVPAAAALGFALYLRSPLLVMTAIVITTVGAFIVLPVWWQLPRLFLTGPAAAGGIGVIAAVGNSSGFVAPYLTGWLRDLTGDYRAGMLVIAGFMLSAAASTLLLGRDSAFREVSGLSGHSTDQQSTGHQHMPAR